MHYKDKNSQQIPEATPSEESLSKSLSLKKKKKTHTQGSADTLIINF